ncbi:hypothetical protein [Nocardia testacea]|uniref:hypothetical protein n=1 Tax=Nocardia testacea TaxID=248551 RepID=UPI0005842BCA|nr:hypothetical protein [Nocardia testacea]
MIDWLAQDPGPSPSTPWWVSLLTLGAPVAAIVVAWIGGRYTLRSSRKTAYDRLEALVNLRKEWPETLEGLSSLDRSIAHALFEVRRVEGELAHPLWSLDSEWDVYRTYVERVDRLRQDAVVGGLIIVLPLGLASNIYVWRRMLKLPNGTEVPGDIWIVITAMAAITAAILGAMLFSYARNLRKLHDEIHAERLRYDSAGGA